MGPYSSNCRGESNRKSTAFPELSIGKLCVATLLAVFATTLAVAQDVKLNVTYICNGEHIYVDSCNMRDLSDTATCMVEHPDHVNAGGIAAITSETRGSLKKRLPTCEQPSAKELAAHEAFVKKQQEIYAANVAKANPQPVARPNTGGGQSQQAGRITPPKNEEERQMRRCVSSGRLPASCTGNQLLGAFSSMISSVASSVAPGTIKDTTTAIGPEMSGVFQGAGNWRLDFIDGGVLVNCSVLSPNQENYTIDFKTGHPVITIETRPKPLVLALKGSESGQSGQSGQSIVGPPGPVVLDGVIASGTSSSGPDPNGRSGYTDKNGISLTNSQAASSSEVYQGASRHYGPVTPAGTTYTNFVHKQVTCPAINLSSKGGGVGVQTMQTDLLKSMFSDGEKGAPTPPGIRMRGIYASAATGFSVQFFPESVILGCGPDSARAYPYTVVADGPKAMIKVDAPDHPLNIAFEANNALDPGTGSYLVHGRIVTGQDDNDNFTFAPMEQTCNLAMLTPSKTIPMGGGVAATMVASAGNAGAPGSGPAGGSGGLSTPQSPLGNATLSVVSGLPAQPGVPGALAGRPYILLRDSYANAVAKGGVSVPAGTSAYKYAGSACGNHTADCQKINDAIKASAASAVRAGADGSGTFPGVPPGTYYLMISARYNNQPLVWGQAVQLKPGANSVTLNLQNATPLN